LIERRYRSGAAALVLCAVNAYITLRLFHVAYTRQMGSIEGGFIGLARYIRDHFPHLTWFPLWYGGIPFAGTYPPLLHFLVAGVSALGPPPALAYHIVTAALYALGPVALFWAAMRLGADRFSAFAAALGYSLVSPSCWLVAEVRGDSGGWFGPRRLVNLVHYGEGPHVASLLFLILAIGLLHGALDTGGAKRRPHNYLLAALALAATVLCNWIGALALALAAAAYLLADFQKNRLLPAAALGIYAYLIALPWVSPSIVAAIRANTPMVENGLPPSAWPLVILAVSLPILAWGLKRWGVPSPIRFGVLWWYSMAALTLGHYWLHAELVPQAHRYQLEMDLAFWLAAALVLAHIPRPDWLRHHELWAAALLAASLPVILHERRLASAMEAPIPIESTAEYKISHWLGEHLPGRRVFAPGSIGFWMDAFGDTPMLSGGFDQGIRNPMLFSVNYQILAGDKPTVALAWLEAFGCDAIVGDDLASSEQFHPYSHPGRLHGLRELWRDGAEVIYAVPRRGSLAHVIRATDLVREIPAAYDPKPLAPYLTALNDPSLPVASFRWRDPATASIAADLQPGLLLSVQVTWDQGWTASVNGMPRRVWSDKLGQVVVEPRCAGPCSVDLTYTGGTELRLARWTSMLALAAGAAWSGLAFWRARRPAKVSRRGGPMGL
jgi:hypothetical protein